MRGHFRALITTIKPTMANETIGRVRCPRHGNADVWGEISKNKNGRLYYRCGTPDKKWRDGCGLVDDAGANFQEWMLANAEFFTPGATAIETTIASEPVEQLQPEVIPMPEEKKVREKVIVVAKEKNTAKPAKEKPARNAGDLEDGDFESEPTDDHDEWLL